MLPDWKPASNPRSRQRTLRFDISICTLLRDGLGLRFMILSQDRALHFLLTMHTHHATVLEGVLMKAGASKKNDSHSCGRERSATVYWIEIGTVPIQKLDLFELVSCSLAELGPRKDIDLVLLSGTTCGTELVPPDVMAGLKAARPDFACIIVTGSGADDENHAESPGRGRKRLSRMKPHSPAEFIQAMRIVHAGSVWAAPSRALYFYRTRDFVSRAHLSRRQSYLY